MRNSESLRVLVVEDDCDLAANVRDCLVARGHAVEHVANGTQALRQARAGAFDAIVLDLGLPGPGPDGMEVCRQIRATVGTPPPILVLTARDTERDVLAAFEAGADDYVTKPFSLAQVLARLVAITRRARPQLDRVTIGDLMFDRRTLSVTRAGRPIDVSPAERRLLERLMVAAPAVVRRAELEHAVWGGTPPDSEGALRVHVHGLRQALGGPAERPLIHTVPGVGYRLGGYDAESI